MNGKDKCRILKEIRRQIAEANDIDLVIRECTHKGDCKGTCPRCEAEVRYLEEQLEKRRQGRKRVALAGISAGAVMALSGCGVLSSYIQTVVPVPTAVVESPVEEGEIPADDWLMGDIPADDGDVTEGEIEPGEVDEVVGEIAPAEEW